MRFYIGGTQEDYQAFVCDATVNSNCDSDHPSSSFDNDGATMSNAIPTAVDNLNFADPLTYGEMDLMLKI